MRRLGLSVDTSKEKWTSVHEIICDRFSGRLFCKLEIGNINTSDENHWDSLVKSAPLLVVIFVDSVHLYSYCRCIFVTDSFPHIKLAYLVLPSLFTLSSRYPLVSNSDP